MRTTLRYCIGGLAWLFDRSLWLSYVPLPILVLWRRYTAADSAWYQRERYKGLISGATGKDSMAVHDECGRIGQVPRGFYGQDRMPL